MSKISDAILTVEDLYARTKIEYDYWHDRIMYGGNYNEANAIVAAKYYGRLCALADVNYRLLGDEGLKILLRDVNPKLFRFDYEES